MIKHEGVYTPEELELNAKLYTECSKDNPDFELVESLLKQGADPIGAISSTYPEEHVYEELICDGIEDESKNLPKITELFLKYGMDIGNPRVPYDHDDSLSPMWSFSFARNENAVIALKMLLDAGISAEDVLEMWDHDIGDAVNIWKEDPNDKAYNKSYTYMMKKIMLCASYDHIIDNDEDLVRIIGCEYNNYDLHKFRNWNDFYYEFDTSHCLRFPEFYRSVIRIFEVESKKEVWKIGMYLDKEEFL